MSKPKVGLHCPKCGTANVDVAEAYCRNCKWDILYKGYVWHTRPDEFNRAGQRISPEDWDKIEGQDNLN